MTNSAVTSQPPHAAVHSRPGGRPVQRWRRLLEGRLLRQVMLPVLVGLLQLGMALVELVRTPVTPASLLWLLGSFVLGFGFGCAIRVVWDDDALQVVLVGGQVLLTLAFVILNVGSKAVPKHVGRPDLSWRHRAVGGQRPPARPLPGPGAPDTRSATALAGYPV